MNHDPFATMQSAVDVVHSSAHATNKIAAALTGADAGGLPYSIAMTNYWPERIRQAFGAGARIGESSGTIHAETACLLTAPRTAGASMFVTDPFCPNCAKNMAEAGVAAVYIDHKGFGKDFAQRREEDFRTMSLPICAHAGLAVYVIDRKTRALEPLVPARDGFTPDQERPITLAPAETGLESQTLRVEVERPHGGRRYAAAIARDANGGPFLLSAFAHPSIGFAFARDRALLQGMTGKYSFMLEPLNRLLMNAARHGLKLADGLVHCSQAPTSREMVNFVGAGLTALGVGEPALARDAGSLQALGMLVDKGVVRVAAPA